MSETRKLAAILVADVAGYSRLTGADEDRTLARLRTLRSDLIDPAIAAHNGRIVKRTGDGIIIEFRSVVDAVRCAIEAQTGMVERNMGLPPEKRIDFRVGIHVGDVVEEADGDLMGDGVNVAARLEGICEPGGICLSEDAYRQVKSQFGPSMAEFETVIALDPNNAWAQAFAGFLKVYLGRAEDGFSGVEAAYRLSPREPNAFWWQMWMCDFHAMLAHWEEAIPWREKSIAGNPQVFYPYVFLAAANAWAGHDKEAKDTAAQLQKVLPGFSVQTWNGRHMSDDPTYTAQYQRITEGLRKAGVPEGVAKTN